MKILITGAAGFIGMHTILRLIARGDEVIGVDNMNEYYSVSMKDARLGQILPLKNFYFKKMDIEQNEEVARLFLSERPDAVVHLAAQPGVRYSIENPHAYIGANIRGFLNILEGCRQCGVKHLVYASSSSVYGGNTKLPFSEKDPVDHPVSLYAATKKANELMAHTYSHLFRIPTTGLRFFTVYGPWGRPDMSPMIFARAIMSGEPIKVFNNGMMSRDFTYIDDIVEGLLRILDKPATPSEDLDLSQTELNKSNAPYRIFNIGNNAPITLMEYISALEIALGRCAIKEYLPMQAGDMKATFADTKKLKEWVNFQPETPMHIGVEKFAKWYKEYKK